MDELAELMPFTALLGARTVTSTPREVQLRLDWSPQRCTLGGVLHGGALMDAVARPLRVGRSVIGVDTELVDAAGRLVARVTQTQTVHRVDR